MKKIHITWIILAVAALIALAVPAHAQITLGDGNIGTLDQFTSTTSPTTAITQRTFGKAVYLSGLNTDGSVRCLQISAAGIIQKAATACGAGGGGGSSAFSTTTSSVPSWLIVYPNNNTDILTIGGSSTSTAPFIFNPNNSRSWLQYASSTVFSAPTLCIGSDCRTSWPTSGTSDFPFTPVSYGNATGTTIGFLNGFLSTASSTINAPLRLSALSQGQLNVGAGGLLYSGVTTTPGTGLSYSGGSFNVNTSQNIATLSNLTTNGFVKTSGSNGTLSIDTNTYLTGNQTITLSGDVTGSGSTAITTTYNNALPVNKGGTGLTAVGASSTVLTSNGSANAFQKLTVGQFLSPNISQWTNDSGYLTAMAFTYPFPAGATSSPLSFGKITSTYASTTGVSGDFLCISTDCRTSWPTGGGSGVWPFVTTDTNYGVAVQSTTTPEWFKNGVFASSTSRFVYASTTGLTVSGDIYSGGIIRSTASNYGYITFDNGASLMDNVGVTSMNWAVRQLISSAGATAFQYDNAAALVLSAYTTDGLLSVGGSNGTVGIATDGTNYWSPSSLTDLNQLTNTPAFISLTGLSATAPIEYDNTTGVISCSTCGAGSSASSTLYADNGTFTGQNQFINNSPTTIRYASSTYTTSGTIETDSLHANTSAGMLNQAANGTNVSIFGVGNSANTLFYGGVNIDGATRLATSLTGPLQSIAGAVTATSTLSTFYGGTGLSAVGASSTILISNGSGLIYRRLTTGELINDAGFLTSLAGAASSTLLADNNSFTGRDTFAYASTTHLTLLGQLYDANNSVGTAGFTLMSRGAGLAPTWSATTTFSTGLTYSAGNVTCDTASASVFGCLTAASFSKFNSPTTTAGTGLTYSGNAFNVNTSQNIATLSNLTSNGFVKTSGGTGALSVDTNTYLTGSGAGLTAVSVASANGFAGSSSGGSTPALTLSTTITGVLKGNGTAISAGADGTDYTLIDAITCSAGQFLNAFTAAGVGTCGTPTGGGGGSGGGTWSTTTSSVPSWLVNYPNNNTDVVVIGGNSTSTGAAIINPNETGSYAFGTRNPTAVFNIASANSATALPLLQIASSSDGVSTSTEVTVDWNGNVGIGTTSPQAKLSINVKATDTHAVLIGSSTTLYAIDSRGRAYYGGATPTVSSCGTSPTIIAGSNDMVGWVRIGTGNAAATQSCTVNFTYPWISRYPMQGPQCNWNFATSSARTTVSASTTATTATFRSNGAAGNMIFGYTCTGIL